MNTFHTDCIYWKGIKPCNKQKANLTKECHECTLYSPIRQNILIIEAGGLGSVLRSSVVSKELKKIYPHSIIQWLTNSKSMELILGNIPSVDRVYTMTWENIAILHSQIYYTIINFESNPAYLAFVSNCLANKKGFMLNDFGNLTTASLSAREFLKLQTNDYFRRRENKKSMQQILMEVSGLIWRRQNYDIVTRKNDDNWATAFLKSKGIARKDIAIGLNIGSSLRHSAKRWLPQYFYKLAELCLEYHLEWKLVILAGPEDVDAYMIIADLNNNHRLSNLIFTGHDNTVSQFISLINKINIIISVDTFGLHVALGLKKITISLWGPQPKNETYSYGKDTKISLDLDCAPCFIGREDKCPNPIKLQCMREISVQAVFRMLEEKIIKNFNTS